MITHRPVKATDRVPALMKCLRFIPDIFNRIGADRSRSQSPELELVQVGIIVSSGILYHTATLITTASCFANDGLNCSGIETMTMPSYAV